MGTHTPTPPSTAPAYARIAVRAAALAVLAAGAGPDAQEPVWREVGGVYPHLAMLNSGHECGAGGGVWVRFVPLTLPVTTGWRKRRKHSMLGSDEVDLWVSENG